ncbi:MAG: nuclear transport factor 2 family protein [Ferruginibacter sp.]
MKSLIAMMVCLGGISSVKAQTEKDAVAATIQNFFAGMKNADTVKLKSTLASTATLQTIVNNGGEVQVKDEPFADFISMVAKLTPGDADEQIEIGNINIDGDLASVWTPYHFYYKGKFSHCGVNSFQLVKIANSWKIQYIIDTRRKEGCN